MMIVGNYDQIVPAVWRACDKHGGLISPRILSPKTMFLIRPLLGAETCGIGPRELIIVALSGAYSAYAQRNFRGHVFLDMPAAYLDAYDVTSLGGVVSGRQSKADTTVSLNETCA